MDKNRPPYLLAKLDVYNHNAIYLHLSDQDDKSVNSDIYIYLLLENRRLYTYI